MVYLEDVDLNEHQSTPMIHQYGSIRVYCTRIDPPVQVNISVRSIIRMGGIVG